MISAGPTARILERAAKTCPEARRGTRGTRVALTLPPRVDDSSPAKRSYLPNMPGAALQVHFGEGTPGDTEATNDAADLSSGREKRGPVLKAYCRSPSPAGRAWGPRGRDQAPGRPRRGGHKAPTTTGVGRKTRVMGGVVWDSLRAGTSAASNAWPGRPPGGLHERARRLLPPAASLWRSPRRCPGIPSGSKASQTRSVSRRARGEGGGGARRVRRAWRHRVGYGAVLAAFQLRGRPHPCPGQREPQRDVSRRRSTSPYSQPRASLDRCVCGLFHGSVLRSALGCLHNLAPPRHEANS